MPAFCRFRSGCVFSIAGIALALAGCTVQRAHTIPFDGRDNKGVVYSIPKTYLQVTLQYAYERDDLRPGPLQAHLQGPLKIIPLLVPDEKSTFIVKTDSFLSNVLFLTSVNFKFSNGTLESVDASAIDRTGQIIEELSTTAVNIAKAAAKGEATPHERAMMAAEKRVDDIYAAIAKAAAEPLDAPRSAQNLESLQNELNVARKLILDLRNNVDPPLRTFTAPLTVMLDPDAPTRETDDYLEFEVKPPQLFPDVPEDNMDEIYIRIYDNHRRGLTDSLHEGHRPYDTSGIIYRQPVPLLTKVLAGADEDDTTEVFSGLIPYLQFAPPSVAVIDSKVLTSKHTTLVLDTVNGGVITYGISQDSAIANAAQAAATASKAAVDVEKTTKPQPAGRGSTPGGGKSSTSGRGATPSSGGGPAASQPGGGTGGRGGAGSSGGRGSGGSSPPPL
jgi:hypothetical protein